MSGGWMENTCAAGHAARRLAVL